MYYKVCINSEKADINLKRGLNGAILEVEFLQATNDLMIFELKDSKEIIILPLDWIYWMIPLK